MPAWLRSLTGRKSEPVVLEKAICQECKIIGPGVVYAKTVTVEREDGHQEEVLYEGLRLTTCGHVVIFLVTDDKVREHFKKVEKLFADCRRYVAAGDLGSAVRADKRHKEAQKKMKSAARRAWRDNVEHAPEGVKPLDSLK